MKCVMLAIRPKYCEKICHEIGTDKNGKPVYEKTIEVRKTKPSIPAPFKVYIYCTKDKPYLYRVDDDNNFELTNTLRQKADGYVKDYNEQNGKVIGEFICDKIEKFSVGSLRSDDIINLACLSYCEMIDYFYKPEELDGKTAKYGYAWHITDLKIYDTPKELNEFFDVKYDTVDYCVGCPHHETPVTEYPCCDCVCEAGNRKYLTRPPQSWCYVQE